MNDHTVRSMRNVPEGTFSYIKGTTNIWVTALLHKIGDQKPYFSVTAEIGNSRRNPVVSGICHREILQVFPELEDLVLMHLSDIDGVPMYAEANGWYFLERYLEGYRREDLDYFKNLVRISSTDAIYLIYGLRRVTDGGIANKEGMRGVWGEVYNSMKPRWKREAEACIAKYNLEVGSRGY